MKQLVASLTVLTVAFSAQASLLLDGDFSGTSAFGNVNHYDYSMINSGWATKGSAWTRLSGAAVNTTDTLNNERHLAQIVSIGVATGSQYQLTFDWTAPASATVPDSLGLTYTVVAWKAGAAPAAADRLFEFINNTVQATKANQANGGGTDGNMIDLLDGTEYPGTTASFNATPGTFVGTAGVLKSATVNLNFGTSSIENFDYIGVRFFTGNDTTENPGGGILDNVVIQAVPEPNTAALAVFLLGGLALRGLRSRW